MSALWPAVSILWMQKRKWCISSAGLCGRWYISCTKLIQTVCDAVFVSPTKNYALHVALHLRLHEPCCFLWLKAWILKSMDNSFSDLVTRPLSKGRQSRLEWRFRHQDKRKSCQNCSLRLLFVFSFSREMEKNCDLKAPFVLEIKLSFSFFLSLSLSLCLSVCLSFAKEKQETLKDRQRSLTPHSESRPISLVLTTCRRSFQSKITCLDRFAPPWKMPAKWPDPGPGLGAPSSFFSKMLDVRPHVLWQRACSTPHCCRCCPRCCLHHGCHHCHR